MTQDMQILKKSEGRSFKKAKKLGSSKTIELIRSKGICGRGGANFCSADKWSMVINSDETERYLICNADEGEPGTFKDRLIIEQNPETLIEGVMIGMLSISAKKGYIYLRDEYSTFKRRLQLAIKKLNNELKTDYDIEVFVGAGAYVCGDETAIISSIEGLRGQPRKKPPFPTQQGLFGKPTVINNVETLTDVALCIDLKDWNPKKRLCSISGDVLEPGVFEIEEGDILSDVVKLAKPKEDIKSIHFGAFGGCIDYQKHKNMKLDPPCIKEEGCMLGTYTLIVSGVSRDAVDLATIFAKFYEFESCGKCTPCREGSMRILALLQKIEVGKGTKEDIETMQELATVIKETSFCGLGQTSMNHLLTSLNNFKKEYTSKVK